MSLTALRILALHTCPDDLRPFPPELTELVSQGLLQIDPAPNFHAAAAALVLARPPYDALLVDAEILARRHVEMLRLIRRHVSLPLWFYPATRGFGPSPELFPPGALPVDQAVRALQHARIDASTQGKNQSRKENRSDHNPACEPAPGATPLSPAPGSPVLRLHSPATPPNQASQAGRSEEAKRPDQSPPVTAPSTENGAVITSETRAEILVAQAVAPRYDAHGESLLEGAPADEPLLSASEIRALLGSAD